LVFTVFFRFDLSVPHETHQAEKAVVST